METTVLGLGPSLYQLNYRTTTGFIYERCISVRLHVARHGKISARMSGGTSFPFDSGLLV